MATGIDMEIFKTVVLQEFSALGSKFGLEFLNVDEQFVRLQNHYVFLQIHYDCNRSFEIGVEIGEVKLSGAIEKPFNLGEILRSRHQTVNSSWVDNLQVSNARNLPDVLGKLALLVEQYATPFFVGDKDAFADLERFRKKESIKYALDRNIRSARVKADEAWKIKNYQAVIDAYSPFRTYLTSVEASKLTYAETHVHMNSNGTFLD